MQIDLLDQGYLRLVETWGKGDAGGTEDHDRTYPDYEVGIIEAARQSTEGNFQGWEKDRKLLASLFKRYHTSPFEMAGMVVEVHAPIVVFREWRTHRTGSYNEASGRYIQLPADYYLPTKERVLNREAGQEANKQAGTIPGALNLTEPNAGWFLEQLSDLYNRSEELYQKALQIGVPKELARLGMPVAHYSKMRTHMNLHNWLRFMTLRMAPDAMWEIRQYAWGVARLIATQFPKTWGLFADRHNYTLHDESDCPF